MKKCLVPKSLRVTVVWLFCTFCCSFGLTAQISTSGSSSLIVSTIRDIIYQPNGVPFNGTIKLEPEHFGDLNPPNIVYQVIDGVLSLRVFSSTAASPSASYSVTFVPTKKADRWSETWHIPQGDYLRLRDVRTASLSQSHIVPSSQERASRDVAVSVNLTQSDIVNALTYAPLAPGNNLSDLTSPAAARTSLGMDSGANYPTLNQSTTGTAATASAFDHVPKSCGANEFATGIAASGDLTCTPIVGSLGTLPIATNTTFGAVRPDNLSIIVANGVISTTSNGSSNPSGSTIQSTSSVLCGTGTGGGTGCNGAVVGNGSTTTLRDIISVKDFGAASDGKTDNYASIQGAINSACTAIAPVAGYAYSQGADIQLPGITAGQLGSYSYSKPLIIPCSNISLEGRGQASLLMPSYAYGGALYVRPAVGQTPGTYFPFPSGAPLVGSTGNSMYLGCDTTPNPVCASAPNSFPYNVLGHSIIDMAEVINPGPAASGGMGGLGAFTIEAVVNLDNISGDGYILSSYGQKGNAASTSAFVLWYSQGINAFRCGTTINNTTYGINALVNSVTPNTTYALACTYDGSVFRMFVNGKLASSVSATGTLNQSTNENMVIGPLIGAWPLGAYTDTGMVGRIDNVRISNSARYTSAYSPSPSKFVNDGNTLALYAFSNQFDAFTQVSGQNGIGWAQYQVIEDERVSFIQNVTVRNLAIQQSATGSGLNCLYTPNSKLKDLFVYFGFRMISFPSNCFESHIDTLTLQPGGSFNGFLSGGEWGVFLGGGNGIIDMIRPLFYGGEYQLVSSGDASFQVENAWFQTEATTIDSIFINGDQQAINNYFLSSPSFSSESAQGGAPNLSELIYVSRIGGVLTIQGGYFEAQTTNVSQLMTIDGIPSGPGGNGQINLIGNAWNSPPTASQFINFTSSAVGNPVVAIGNSFITRTFTPPASIPVTNRPEYLNQVPFPIYKVSTLPNCSAGQMATVTDASNPTYLGALTGGGPTASTSVLCPRANTWVSH
jgi:hypothetical protein